MTRIIYVQTDHLPQGVSPIYNISSSDVLCCTGAKADGTTPSWASLEGKNGRYTAPSKLELEFTGPTKSYITECLLNVLKGAPEAHIDFIIPVRTLFYYDPNLKTKDLIEGWIFQGWIIATIPSVGPMSYHFTDFLLPPILDLDSSASLEDQLDVFRIMES